MTIERFKEYAASSMGEERVNGLTSQEVKSLEQTFARDCKGIDWADRHPSDVLIDEIRKLYDDWCDEYCSWKGIHITHKDEDIPSYYEYIKEHLNETV